MTLSSRRAGEPQHQRLDESVALENPYPRSSFLLQAAFGISGVQIGQGLRSGVVRLSCGPLERLRFVRKWTLTFELTVEA